MINAWVLYFHAASQTFKFEQLATETGYDEVRPTKWGLDKADDVIAVFQGLQFLAAWIEGQQLDKRNNA